MRLGLSRKLASIPLSSFPASFSTPTPSPPAAAPSPSTLSGTFPGKPDCLCSLCPPAPRRRRSSESCIAVPRTRAAAGRWVRRLDAAAVARRSHFLKVPHIATRTCRNWQTGPLSKPMDITPVWVRMTSAPREARVWPVGYHGNCRRRPPPARGFRLHSVEPPTGWRWRCGCPSDARGRRHGPAHLPAPDSRTRRAASGPAHGDPCQILEAPRPRYCSKATEAACRFVDLLWVKHDGYEVGGRRISRPLGRSAHRARR